MFIQLLIIGGMLYTTAKTFIEESRLKSNQNQPPADNKHISPPPEQLSVNQSTQTTSPLHFAELDEQYQTFIQTKIDPLFGSSRHQQAQELSTVQEVAPVSDNEKIANRNLALVSANLLLGISSFLFYPPLLVATVPVSLYLELRVYKKSYQAIVNEKRVNMAVIDTIVNTGALLAGYYFAVVLVQFLYYVSLKFVARAEDNSRKNLIRVFNQQPQMVWIRLLDGTELEIPFEQLQVGDKVVVKAGEMVPVDGMIVQGVATIDQRVLTGESQPVEKSCGDTVLAATVILAGSIEIQVERTGAQTVAAKIGEMLNSTTGFKTSLETAVEQMIDWTAAPTLVLSGLALPVAGRSGALGVLGSGVGFNMRVLAPLSMLNFLQIASQHSILIKDGRSMEVLSKVDTIVFDKTGTLTLEQMQVTKIHLCHTLTEEELLIYAASAEYRQTHPIAKAILEEAETRSLTLLNLADSRYEMGYGIKVTLADLDIRVGSSQFMQLENIVIPEEIVATQQTCHKQGSSLVLVACNDQLVGAIELRATIRPEAKQVIQALQRRQLKVYIISGDFVQPTQTLAQELGIEHYFANILPEHKATLVKQLQQEGKTVCFVGDGINDAIALKQADVSISLRGATTVATDMAQIVLMDETLKQLPYLLEVGKRFESNMKTNLMTSIVPGVICVSGVFFLHFGLHMAVLLDNTSLVAGLYNSMQVIRETKHTDPKQLPDK